MSEISDYADRKYDFLALQNVKAAGDQQLGLELFTAKNSGQICAGVQKLTQRWLLEFLTETGSMPGAPTRGTDFMRLVRQGRLRTTANITAQFNFAAYAARANLAKEEDDTWPDDERIGNVTLMSLAFLPGYAKLYIQILSRAGAARSVILPISTLPTGIA